MGRRDGTVDFLVYDIDGVDRIACATSLRLLIYQSPVVYVMNMESMNFITNSLQYPNT